MGVFTWFADLAIKGILSVSGGASVGGNLTVSSANGRYVGIDGLADGHEVDFRFGDAYNRIGTKYGDVVFISSYHGVKLGNYGGGSKVGLTVVNAQANTNIAEFFGSDNVRKIAITQAGALVFSDGTSMATAAVGGGATAAVVATKTRQGIQDALDLLPTTSTTRRTIILEGDYENGSKSDCIILSKSNVHLVSYSGSSIKGDANNGFLLKIYGCTNTTVDGITFYSPYTGGANGLIMLNQSGSTNRISIINCTLDCQAGTYNAISVVAFADNDATSLMILHNYLQIDNCDIYAGRMGVEFVAHCWSSSVVRVTNPRVTNCRFWVLGKNDPNFGMAISFSGKTLRPICEDNWINGAKDTGIEGIGCANGEFRRNTIVSTVSGCKGIALTDGKQYETNGIAGVGSTGCIIVDNYIDVLGPVVVLFYANGNKIGKNSCKGQGIQWQHADSNTVDMFDLICSDETFVTFDASSNNTITGGRWITTKSTTPRYQNWMSSNGSTGNWLKYVHWYGTDSANGNRIQRNGTGTFFWMGGYMDNVKVPDSLNGDKSLSNANQLVA